MDRKYLIKSLVAHGKSSLRDTVLDKMTEAILVSDFHYYRGNFRGGIVVAPNVHFMQFEDK